MSEVVCIGCGWEAYIVCCSELPVIEIVCKACVMEFKFKGKEKCQSCNKTILHKIAKLKSDLTRQLNSADSDSDPASLRFQDPLCLPHRKPHPAHPAYNRSQISQGIFFQKTQNNRSDPKQRSFNVFRASPFASVPKEKEQFNFTDLFRGEGFNAARIRDAIRYSDEVLDLPPDYDAIIQKERLKMGNAIFAPPGAPQESRKDYFDQQSEMSGPSSLDQTD